MPFWPYAGDLIISYRSDAEYRGSGFIIWVTKDVGFLHGCSEAANLEEVDLLGCSEAPDLEEVDLLGCSEAPGVDLCGCSEAPEVDFCGCSC